MKPPGIWLAWCRRWRTSWATCSSAREIVGCGGSTYGCCAKRCWFRGFAQWINFFFNQIQRIQRTERFHEISWGFIGVFFGYHGILSFWGLTDHGDFPWDFPMDGWEIYEWFDGDFAMKIWGIQHDWTIKYITRYIPIISGWILWFMVGIKL